MNIYYEITSTNEVSEDGEHYLSYGIKIAAEDGSSAAVEDISPEREKVEALAKIFEAEQLEPVHLFDAVYDALCKAPL